MAGKVIGIWLVAVLVALLCANVAAQSDNCNSVILRLAPCLPYVTGKTPSPSQPCCSQLASVVSTQPRCLCELINGGGDKFGVNKTLALALPGLCNVKTPPVSQCNATAPAIPPSAPATPSKLSVSNPSSTTTSTISTKSTPSVPSGSKAIPSGQSSNGSSNKYRRR